MSCQKNFKGGDEDKSCLNPNLEKEMLDKQSTGSFLLTVTQNLTIKPSKITF